MYTVYTKEGCTFCDKAKEILDFFNEEYDEIKHRTQEEIETFKSYGFKTFPQIFLGGEHVGGYTDLESHLIDIHS